jgi:hypothetical protein
MKRSLAYMVAATLSASAQARGANAQLCVALEELRAVAARTHQPQQVYVIKAEAMASGCGRSDDTSTQRAFCEAALNAIGIEFTHSFPWAIYDCLRQRRVSPVLETSAQYTGLVHRRRITHLTARWSDGGRIEIRYVPSGDFSNEPEFRGYWGRYDLVITTSR